MRLLVVPVLLLALAACGSEDGQTARDPGPTAPAPADTAGVPAAPVPDGPVRTRDLAIVMDTGTPQLCVGPVAESYPPQCGGPEITNWDWATMGQEMYEQQGQVRWGSYAVTGRWDGTSFEATEAVPAALYDPAMPSPSATPSPAQAYSDAELQAIAERLARERPDVSAYGAEGTGGHVLVDVFFDDGSLQEWADQEYGAGVVLVSSALVEAG